MTTAREALVQLGDNTLHRHCDSYMTLRCSTTQQTLQKRGKGCNRWRLWQQPRSEKGSSKLPGQPGHIYKPKFRASRVKLSFMQGGQG